MKKLNQRIDLNGKVEEITMMELRKNPGEVLNIVSMGGTFIIKRNGKPLGVISKLPGVELRICVDGEGKISYENPNIKSLPDLVKGV